MRARRLVQRHRERRPDGAARARAAGALARAALVAALVAHANPLGAQVRPERPPTGGPPRAGPAPAPPSGAPGRAATPSGAAPFAPDAPPTALEAWLAQPGRVVVERRRPMPAISLDGGARLALEAVVAFEPVREHERALGVRVRLLGAGRAERDAVVYLDPFEVDDLARTLAALPALERLERSSGGPAEIRHVSRDGFGVLVSLAPAASSPRRALRFPGEPPLELPASDAALRELHRQLDAARAFLFTTPGS